MAIVYIQQKKIQRNLILVFLAVLLITGFITWQGFFRKQAPVTPEKIITVSPETIKINFGIFKNPIFQSLQPFSVIQPFGVGTSTETGTTTDAKIGRDNPFLPYK